MIRSLFFLLALLSLCLSGCTRSGTVWEDTKTIGRRLHCKARLLWRQDVDSRMIESSDDLTPPAEEEYIPYQDDDIKVSETELLVPAPREISNALDEEAFLSPEGTLSSLLSTIYFDTDSKVIKPEHRHSLKKIAEYMNKHQNLELRIEGHCDKRASVEYNKALGARRANSVRASLVKLGMDPDRIFTKSFGKEAPIDLGDSPQALARNRRAVFKLRKTN